MDRALTVDWFEASPPEKTAPRPRVAADWPLMGDILTHRMGMPEHLIRWRRAEDADKEG